MEEEEEEEEEEEFIQNRTRARHNTQQGWTNRRRHSCGIHLFIRSQGSSEISHLVRNGQIAEVDENRFSRC